MMKVNILETDTGRILEDELRDWSQAALNQLDKAYGYKSFRPNYLKIGEFIAGLPTRPVVAAFTATATRRQVPEIAHALGLDNPIMLGTGFDRPNIRFDTIELKPAARKKFITNWAKAKQGSGIVYCTTIRRCDELAETLREAGIDAEAFYAPLTDKEKARIQDGFLTGSPRVICATTAFGMGASTSPTYAGSSTTAPAKAWKRSTRKRDAREETANQHEASCCGPAATSPTGGAASPTTRETRSKTRRTAPRPNRPRSTVSTP